MERMIEEMQRMNKAATGMKKNSSFEILKG